MLGRLEQAVLAKEAAEVYWLERRGLAEVIRAGLGGDAAVRQQWSLAGFDLSSILRVSASVGPFDAKIGGPKGAPEATTRLQEELTAQELFERGFASADKNEKLDFYSHAIRLKPDYALALLNRGNVRSELGDVAGALTDYSEALHLKPHVFVYEPERLVDSACREKWLDKKERFGYCRLDETLWSSQAWRRV